MTNDGTEGLSESARDALIEFAARLRERPSGKAIFEYHEGGIRTVEYVERWRPKKKEDAA